MHRFLAALWWAGVVAQVHAASTGISIFSPPDLEFFEKRVRPVLVEHCYSCHSSSSEKLKAGLHLDSRAGVLKGGESGPAAIAGDPENSLLVKAIRYSDENLQMPPRKGKLPDARVADLIEWVRRGLPWPEHDSLAAPSPKREFEITAQDRNYWAFQPIRRPPLPQVHKVDWPANGIDYFILAKLEEQGMEPNPPATRRELIRRAYFDLLGLPPTPAEVAAFEADPSSSAYSRLIDQLLTRPEYGERWARHWLDIVRYAQSNGYERDGEKPLAWRYRDYVVRALNEDKPYTRFIEEQIAGDELPDATADSVVATGFQRLGVWDDEPDDKTTAEFDELDDIVSTTGAAFLGLTLGCARCHDHKFDPISQRDYYQFLAFFRNLRPNASARYELDSPNYLPLASPRVVRHWEDQHDLQIQMLQSQIDCAEEGPDKRALQERLKKLTGEKPPFQWALAARDRGGKYLPTHLLIRGNAHSPGPEVEPGFPQVFAGEKAPASPAIESSLGRRTVLAHWIASPSNPLTARVAVNRVWHHHFGQGLVKTTADFGRAGTAPTHPQLLDWLATQFIDSGWSLKELHRLILLSSTYQMSARTDNPKALVGDPGDNLLWRHRLRRLEAEEVRDNVLAVSGELNQTMGGRGFFPRLDGEVLAGESRPGLDCEMSSASVQARRSLYIFVRRTMLVPLLEAFDYNNTSSPLAERPITTVAPQALMLLNSEWIQARAASFASRLAAQAGTDPHARIRLAYELALARSPDQAEEQTALNFLESQARAFQQIQSRLTFRPNVPNSLYGEYLNQLQPADFLIGPRQGWSYFRGRWSGAYEGIRSMDRPRGPFALWSDRSFADGTIEIQFVLQRAAESASLLLRSKAEKSEQQGYELLLDPRQQRVVLRRHAKSVDELAQAQAQIPTAQPFWVRVNLAGGNIRVWSGPGSLMGVNSSGEVGLSASAAPLIEFSDSKAPFLDGYLGLRSAGAGLCVDSLVLKTGKETIDVAAKTASARSQPAVAATGAKPDVFGPLAWRSFCLLLLNLNEFAYVD